MGTPKLDRVLFIRVDKKLVAGLDKRLEATRNGKPGASISRADLIREMLYTELGAEEMVAFALPEQAEKMAERWLHELGKQDLLYTHHGEVCAREEAYTWLGSLIRKLIEKVRST